jgi:hypothetical protein
MLRLYDIPTPLSVGLFAAAFVGFTWLGIFCVRPYFRGLFREQAGLNELVGDILAAHCALFGLLLGRVAVAAYQGVVDLQQTLNREAAYLRAIHRSRASYPEPERSEIREKLRDYTRFVVEEAWPDQRRGIVSSGGVGRMNAIYEKLFAFEPRTKGQEILHDHTLSQFNEMAEVRRARVQGIRAGLPPLMWAVVGLGSLITVLLLWAFEMRLVLHFAFSGRLTLFLSSVVCLIVAMAHPFRGKMGLGRTPTRRFSSA